MLAAALITLLGSGCTRPVREDVFLEGTIDVSLRNYKRGFSIVEKDYEHPVTIAPVRIAHILSRIDMRSNPKKPKERVAAIRTDMLFPIARGVSQALDQADENQQIVVIAIHRWKHLKVFERKNATSFVAYVRDDRLYIHMSRADYEILPQDKDPNLEPSIGYHPMKFRLFAGTAMTLVNDQTVAVEWNDKVFKNPTRTRTLPSGEVMRKTILLDSPIPDSEDEAAEPNEFPADLSPEQLRALADLEEQRQQGRITESDYRAKRRKILAP